MSKIEEVINEIKYLEKFDKIYKSITKIKMKEEFYKHLAREVQEQANITEVLDENNQPLNKICNIIIEIDNSIYKDYEFEILSI